MAYASLNNNYALLEKCDESPADMHAMRDNDFYTYAKLVLSESNTIIADLANYGVVPADWADADVNANKYLDVIQEPRVQITERSKVLQELNEAVSSTDAFLKDKLDKVMGVFQASKPTFYAGYLSARSIDDTGNNTPPDYEDIAAPNAITQVVKISYLAARSFDIKNTGTVPLVFSLSSSNTAIEGNLVSIEPNSFATRKSTTLNEDNNAVFLLCQNSDPILAGSYKIWMTE